MKTAPQPPPHTVLVGLASLVAGASAQMPLNGWPEPWRSIGGRLADAPGRRQEILRECLQDACGDEAEHVARSIFAIDPHEPVPHDEPWELPIPFDRHDLPPFPTDTLPAWQRGFVEAIAEATQTPPDMAAMMSLSVLAMALARKVVVSLQSGWLEPRNIWTVTTMEPANRKSAVVRALMEPVEAWQREEERRLAPDIRKAQERVRILEARVERMRLLAARARGEVERAHVTDEILRLVDEAASVKIPTPPKLATDDCTPEMMATLLAEHNGRMAIVSAEGNILELMAGRYSKGRPNLGIFLAGHAGDAYRVDRRGRPAEHLPHPAITVGITIQKEVLRSMARQPGFRGHGLLARFLYCLPESRLGRRRSDPTPVPGETAQDYDAHLRALLSLPFNLDEHGEKSVHVVHLAEGARQALRRFQDAIERQLGPYDELGFINDWGGKLCGAVGRLAGLLHSARLATRCGPWEAPIQAEDMERAIHLGGYLIEHAKASFAEMRREISPLFEDVRIVLSWIRKHRVATFTERDLHQALRGTTRFKQAEALQPVLELLIEHTYLRRQRIERQGPGRRPAVLEVNPAFVGPGAAGSPLP